MKFPSASPVKIRPPAVDKHPGPGRGCVLERPLYLPSRRINGLQKTAIRPSLFGRKICAAVIGMAGLVGLRSRAENVALIACSHIEERRLRIVGRGHEVRRPQRARANRTPFGRRGRLIVRHGTACGIFRVAPGSLAVGGSPTRVCLLCDQSRRRIHCGRPVRSDACRRCRSSPEPGSRPSRARRAW